MNARKCRRHATQDGKRLSVVAAGLALTCAMVAAPSTGRADDEKPLRVDFEASAGAEYDSNISVIQLDTATAADDIAAVFDATIEVEGDLASGTTVRAGYDFSQSLHADFTNFDLQTHRASAGLTQEIGKITFDLDYSFVDARLGRKGFLTINRIAPALSGFIGKKLFWRLEYVYTDKNFTNRTARDSKVNAGSLSLYYFLNGTRSYWTLRYRYEDENAVAPEFDFRGHEIRLRYTRRFPVAGQDSRLRLTARYEKRNYRAITPSIGVVRDDDRYRFNAEWRIPLTRHLFFLAEYEFASFVSNLPSADFNQHLVSGRLGVTF